MNRLVRLTVPLLLLIVATVFFTLVVVGKVDHVVWMFALAIFLLTAVNFASERLEQHERRRG